MNLLVYVCAPFEDGAFVRALHERLETLQLTPTSRWAEHATSREDFARYSPVQLREYARRNDADLRGSDVALVLARHGGGGEMFAEARLALEWGKAVVWVGKRHTLSAFRSGVVRTEDLDTGIARLVLMRERHLEGYRGELLAHLSGAAA